MFAVNGQYLDKRLTCRDCNNPFIFSVGEQKFYESKNFETEPTRCKPCRDTHKAKKKDECRKPDREPGLASFAEVWNDNFNSNKQDRGRQNRRR
jgi:hypothetical protein